MKPVDVLGDDRGYRAAAGQFGDRTMAAIGLGVAPHVVGLEAPAPGFAPGFFGGEKIRKIDRRHFRPDAAGAAEIWDAGLGADAGSGEDDGLACTLDETGEFGDLIIDRHAASLANQSRLAKFPV